MATRNNNGDWLGGLIFCLFPLALFIRSFIQPLNLELGVWALMILFFITGINLMVTAMFKLETKVVAKAITGGIYGVGFGLVAILIGWSAKTGWSGSWQNLLPDSWTQTIPRALFLAGGIGCCALGLSSFRNAYRKWGLNNDQENENARLAAEAEEKRREAVWKDPKGKKGAYFLLLIVILFTGSPGLI